MAHLRIGPIRTSAQGGRQKMTCHCMWSAVVSALIARAYFSGCHLRINAFMTMPLGVSLMSSFVSREYNVTPIPAQPIAATKTGGIEPGRGMNWKAIQIISALMSPTPRAVATALTSRPPHFARLNASPTRHIRGRWCLNAV